MLTVGSLLLGTLLALVAWHRAMQAREAAIEASRSFCRHHGLQLLDDTVALHRIERVSMFSLENGLRRIYRFEYSDEGIIRMRGEVAIRHGSAEAIYLSLPDDL